MINKREHCVDNINSRDEDKVNSFPIVRSKHNYGENDRNRTLKYTSTFINSRHNEIVLG